jgi:hypothetical protein
MEKTPTIKPICPGVPPILSKKRGKRLNADKEEKVISTRKCMAKTIGGKVLSSNEEMDLFMWKRIYSV